MPLDALIGIAAIVLAGLAVDRMLEPVVAYLRGRREQRSARRRGPLSRAPRR